MILLTISGVNQITGVSSENLPMRISNTELICADRFFIDQKYLIKIIYLFEGNEIMKNNVYF